MRDIGALLWVAIVAIGVISSVVSNARRQAARTPVPPRRFPQATVPPPPRPAARPAAAYVDPDARPVPQGAPPAPADVFAHPAERAHPRRPHRFAGRTALMHAVVAAEVLGKPRALRDEYP
jgi:hypothetical protein